MDRLDVDARSNTDGHTMTHHGEASVLERVKKCELLGLGQRSRPVLGDFG